MQAMARSTAWLLAVALVVLSGGVQAEPNEAVQAARVEFFEKKVRPILADHCYACHSADTKPSGGLRVDDRNGLLTGGNTGPAIVAGDPAKSLLLKRVTQKEEKKRMPLEGKHLTDEQVAVLTTWIKDGAAWPAVHVPVALGKPKPAYEKLKKEHWAWQPLTDPRVPTVRNTTWARLSLPSSRSRVA